MFEIEIFRRTRNVFPVNFMHPFFTKLNFFYIKQQQQQNLTNRKHLNATAFDDHIIQPIII